jgi:hypothetical protein
VRQAIAATPAATAVAAASPPDRPARGAAAGQNQGSTSGPQTIGAAAPSYQLGRITDLATARSATMMGFLAALLTLGLAIYRCVRGEAPIWYVAIALSVVVGLWFMSRPAAVVGLVFAALFEIGFWSQPGAKPAAAITLAIFLPIIFLSAVNGTFAFHRLIGAETARTGAR